MEKRCELADPKSCLNKASAHEVIFVLRANDPLAAMTIRHWATMAEGVHEDAKVTEAMLCADAMEAWRNAKLEKLENIDNVPRPNVKPARWPTP